MSNLGDSNTPVEGESFGLPAGAEFTEDANGNLAIADSTGSIVLVRDETNAEWQFENTDLTGINAIDASSANLDDATVANSPTNNDDVVRKTETDAIQNDVDGKVEQTEFDNHSTQHEDGGTDALDLTGLSGDLADQQQPTDHAHDGAADSGGASLNPEATTLQDTQEPTTDGEIRRSGSDVYIHTGGNSRNTSDLITASQVEKLWVEDGNSPESVTSTGSITYTPAQTYDIYHVYIRFTDISEDLENELRLTANGDTGANYDGRLVDGTGFSGENYALIHEERADTGMEVAGLSIYLSGRWNNRFKVSHGVMFDGRSPSTILSAINPSITTPLSSFTITRQDNTSSDFTVEVYGRDMP